MSTAATPVAEVVTGPEMPRKNPVELTDSAIAKVKESWRHRIRSPPVCALA